LKSISPFIHVETSSLSSNPAQSPTITVAVVEDDVPIREVLVHWLEKAEGFSFVGAFPDAESAIANLARAKPDVALVDINLPSQSGIECVRALKPLLPKTQFLMLTVYEDATHIFNALSAGATGYLLKHTPRDALIDAILQVHSGGSPMTSNIARKVVQALQSEPKSKSIDRLSKRENEVLSLLAQGYLYKEIADAMGISLTTVNSYIRRIYEKLQVQSRGQAVAVYADLKKE
jgi:DNA-binding NarL/FixJ family response regulator